MKALLVSIALLSFYLQVQPAFAARHFDAAGVWPTLGDGNDKPSAVRGVQYLLKAKGFNLAVDGRYGEQTRGQVRRFQRERNMAEWLRNGFGVVDAFTWESLIPELKRGDRGWAVRAVQTLLCARGYRVVIDGRFGVQTERAVSRFKAQNCLTGYGMWTLPGVVERFTWCELVGGRPYRGLAECD